MSTDPVNFDISGTADEQTDAIMQALLYGRPLTISESTRPDLPPVGIGLELSRAAEEPPSSAEVRAVDRVVAVDGRDALAYVIVRPGRDGEHVEIEAAAKGLDKATAAHILRRVAASFERDHADRPDVAEQAQGNHDFPPNGGHAGPMCAYVAGIGSRCTCD